MKYYLEVNHNPKFKPRRFITLIKALRPDAVIVHPSLKRSRIAVELDCENVTEAYHWASAFTKSFKAAKLLGGVLRVTTALQELVE